MHFSLWASIAHNMLHYPTPSALNHDLIFLITHDVAQNVLDRLRTVEVCYIQKHISLIRCMYTSWDNPILDARREYLPQCWSVCFGVLLFILLCLAQFKISRNICVLYNTKAVGSARAFICISGTSRFTALKLKLSR